MSDRSKGEVGHAVPLYNTDNLSRDDWRAGRAEYVGASEVAAVLGLHPRKGPLSVYMAKTEGEPEIDNAAIRRGIRREPLILADASDALGEELSRPVPVVTHPWVLRHPEVAVLSCNLDGLAVYDETTQAPVEAKWQGSWARRDWQSYSEEGVPPAGSYLECHYIQVQAQLAVTGLPHAYLAGDCDARFYLLRVERDPSLIDAIVEQVDAFWRNHVEAGVPPQATASDADALRRAYRESKAGKVVDLAAVAIEVGKLRELRAQRKEIEKEEKRLRAVIEAELLDGERGILPDGSAVKYINVRRTSLDKTALEAAHPGLLEQFTRKITTRQFRP